MLTILTRDGEIIPRVNVDAVELRKAMLDGAEIETTNQFHQTLHIRAADITFFWPTQPASIARQMSITERVLLIIRHHGGATRAEILASDAWSAVGGRPTAPAPGNLTRALQALEAANEVSQSGERWSLTQQGYRRAEILTPELEPA